MKKLIVLIVFSFFLLNGYNQSKTKANDLLQATNRPVEIGFVKNFVAPDLQINRLTAVLDGDQVVFTLTYHSQKERFLSFFSPPDGDVLNYIDWNGIKKNDTIATFRIAKEDFQSVDCITMRFSTNKNAESDRNFIFLDLSKPSVKKLLVLTNQSVEIGFGEDFVAPDLQINRLTAILDKDQVVFTLTYHSQKDRFLAFFTPPDGDILKYINWNGIKKNDTIATFHIAKNDFQSVDNITMRFSTNKKPESDRNFIFLEIYEPTVKKILGISGNKHMIFAKNFPLSPILMIIIAFCLLVPLVLFMGNKANSYSSFIEKWIKNKWLAFNVKVVFFSIAIMLIILLSLFITGHLLKPLPVNVYLYLLLIPVFPANLVYLIENVFFKNRKMFWLRQYLNLVFITIGLYIIYKVCNEMTDKMIAREIISLEYVILCGIVVGFVLLINNYISFQKIASLKEKELEISRLKELKVRSDLNALQSKINPHFLYNALNSIAELCWKDAKKTEQMALSLSKLFRYSINKEEEDFNPLKNEIEIVSLYLSIEKERLGDNLNYQFDYSKEIENILIPKFTLQPLIENAIKHGIAKNPNGGHIKLTITKMKNQLEIKVYDNGPDFPVNLMSGYGLQSIYDKLDIFYPKRYSIELHNGIEKNITLILKDGV